MGETVSDQDTFVSIENLICSPQPTLLHANEDTSHPNLSGVNSSLNEDGHTHSTPRGGSNNPDSSSFTPTASASPLEDHSTFMWNLYAPECGDVTGGTEDCEDTLEVPGDSEETQDPSDICGEFNTTSFKKPFVRARKQRLLASEKQQHSQPKHHMGSAEGLAERFPSSVRTMREQEEIASVQTMGPSANSLNAQNPPGPVSGSRGQTEEVLHNATNGVVSYMIENPFPLGGEHDSASPNVILYTSMGSFSEVERRFWESLCQEPTSPHASVLRRFVETLQFQQKQVQDLKAAEIQIASATLQSERRRHSEVEHERSTAIETLMEQLSEECEHRSSLEEENANLMIALAELRNQNEEVLSYFTKRDKDFTFTGGVTKALDKYSERLDGARQLNQETVQVLQKKLDEAEAGLIKTKMIAEERSMDCAGLESQNQKLQTELRAFKDEKPDSSLSTTIPVTTTSASAPISERDALLRELREMEAEVQKVSSSLRMSRAEQCRVNEAILSMNVELEDSKRRCIALRKQRDSAERRFKDLIQNATSDRERFFKFQSEMSANFASAVNEVEERKNEIYRLHKELDDRDKAFQIQAATVKHLQEQLRSITEAAVQRSTQASEEGNSVEKDHSLAAMVIKSLRDEVSQASSLLKERGEELESLRQQIYSKDELLSSVQVECAKLRTAASVRRLTSRMSHGSSVSTEQQKSTFLRRLSQKLRSSEADDGEVLKRLTERIDILSHERSNFEGMKENLIDEVKQREVALHALRAEMAAEIATLKADVRHQETLRVRAQDDCKSLEDKYRELLATRKASYRESLGDITSSSSGFRDWSLAEESEPGSRRESSFSTARGEEGVRWKDPIIEDAIRCLNALIGRKDDLSARNRELREKLDGLLRNIGISNEDGERIRALLLQSKDFQDELTKIVGMQEDILGSLANSGNDEVQATAVDDTLPYLRHELSPSRQTTETTTKQPGLITSTAEHHTCGETAQYLRQQLNESRALCNEKLKDNVQLCGVINELRQELTHLSLSSRDLESALHALKDTHEGFVSRLAVLIGAEQSAVAIEDSMRTVMHRAAELRHQHATHKERENVLSKRVTCLIGQKHVLTHIISLYQSKYKLDIMAATPGKESSRQKFRKCVLSIVAFKKMSHFASVEVNSPFSSFMDLSQYELPTMGAIGRRRTGTTSLEGALVAIEAMPRLERAVVEKNTEISSLRESIKALERSLAAAAVPMTRMAHELPTSFVYKEDIMNRKNDMARRLRGVIKEKEELDERLSKEKQARIAAEARSSRYLDKVSVLKRKLNKTLSSAESKERTYKAAIIYLKGKAEKANDDGGWLDENIAPWSPQNPSSAWRGVGDSKRKVPNDESRAILEHELESAEVELGSLEAGSEEHERKSQYIKGLYGGIQRLGQTKLADCGNQLAP